MPGEWRRLHGEPKGFEITTMGARTEVRAISRDDDDDDEIELSFKFSHLFSLVCVVHKEHPTPDGQTLWGGGEGKGPTETMQSRCTTVPTTEGS